MLDNWQQRLVVPLRLQFNRYGGASNERYAINAIGPDLAFRRATAGNGFVRGHGRFYNDFRAPRRGRHVRGLAAGWAQMKPTIPDSPASFLESWRGFVATVTRISNDACRFVACITLARHQDDG